MANWGQNPYGQNPYGPPQTTPGYPPGQQYGAPSYNQPGVAPGYQPGGYGQPGYAPAGPPSGYPGGYPGAGGPGGYNQPPPPPPGVRPDVWSMFQAVDQDRSGKITSKELQQALVNGNWTPFNDETCRLMIGMFDKDRSGTIDVNEFQSLWQYIQDWRACFESYDRDRSGNINAQELHQAINGFGFRLSMDFCNLCVRMFDRTSTQTMKFDDFIQCCVMIRTLTDSFRQKDMAQAGVIDINYETFLEMVIENTVR